MFPLSLGVLSNKATKAYFAIRKKVRLRSIPVHVAIKLFDACVVQILTYGAETWTAYNWYDLDRWDTLQTEQTHLKFCKSILGVNRFTSNLICRSELGRKPLGLAIKIRNHVFAKYCSSLPNDSLASMALSLDNSLKDNENNNLKLFSKCLREMEVMYGPIFHRLSKIRQQSRLYLDNQHAWKSKILATSKGRDFNKFKSNIRFEQYFYLIGNRKYRVQLTKRRASDHNLDIETGRHHKFSILREERICPLCQSEVEEVRHFLLSCPKLFQYRNNMTNIAENNFPNFVH